MIRHRVLMAIALLVSACTTVSNETRTVAFVEGGFYDGERYEIRQRLVDGPTGTFEQTSVVYRGLSRPCILDSPNDCSSAAEALIEAYDETFF